MLMTDVGHEKLWTSLYCWQFGFFVTNIIFRGAAPGTNIKKCHQRVNIVTNLDEAIVNRLTLSIDWLCFLPNLPKLQIFLFQTLKSLNWNFGSPQWVEMHLDHHWNHVVLKQGFFWNRTNLEEILPVDSDQLFFLALKIY